MMTSPHPLVEREAMGRDGYAAGNVAAGILWPLTTYFNVC